MTSQYIDEANMKVVDQKAYKLYQDLKSNPAISEEHQVYVSESDPECEVNLDYPSYRNGIKHLPKEERDKIDALVGKRRSLRQQVRVAREKAYGIKRHSTKLHRPKRYLGDDIDKYRTTLIDLFGSFHTVQQVKDMMFSKHKLHLTKKQLDEFIEDHAKIIEDKRDVYRSDVTSLRLTHKAARVEELTELFYHRKNIWQKTQSDKDHRLMLETLKLVKAEAEGDVSVSINGSIEHTFKQTIEIHVYQNLLKQIPINDMVVARASAKMNLPLATLMNRLHNSYYNKFAGFTRITKSMNVEEIPHPSAHIFDFQRIAQNNKQIVAQDVEAIEEHRSQTDSKVLTSEEQRGELVKKSLLNKLKQRKR